MKHIVKGKEPKKWEEFRNTPGADYEPIHELREALYDEQGGICAYCMRRLFDEHERQCRTKNKVEHMIPRETCSDAQARMDYGNLVLCCDGTISGTSPDVTHCDTHKGSDLISFKPTDEEFIKTLYYNSYGKILSSNSKFNEEINTVLNLNQERLVENRHALIYQIIEWLKSNNPSVREIQRKIEFYKSRNRDGLYEPYCEAAIWRLTKSLKSKVKD